MGFLHPGDSPLPMSQSLNHMAMGHPTDSLPLGGMGNHGMPNGPTHAQEDTNGGQNYHGDYSPLSMHKQVEVC